MFNLIYRDGSPENTGHYESFKDIEGTELKVGTLVSVNGDAASQYASGKPYGVVAISAAEEDEEVTVLRITDEMIFKTVTSANTANLKIGDTLAITATGAGAKATSGDVFEITCIVSKNVVEGRFVTK